MARINRRDFFKMVGVTGGTAGLTACIDIKTPVENVLPYVVQPEQITPGVPTFFSGVCDGCSASCGTVMRHREGRVVFVGGNPDSEVGGGGLCAAGVGSLQDTYEPDRIVQPQDAGADLSWEDAIAKVSTAVSGGGVAWVGRYRTGALGRLIGEFVRSAGGTAVHWEPLGYETIVKASELAFGQAVAPRYVVDNAHVVVSFGADWMHTWLNPVDQSKGWAHGRDAANGGFVSEFYAVEPRLSHTGTRCDTWFASKPGTEAGVAQALARLVADKKGADAATKAWLSGVDPAAAAKAAGIDLDKLKTLAGKLAKHPSVIFPGGPGTQGANGTQLALATLVLNHVCGNIGKSVRYGDATNLGKVSSFADVEKLLADCAAGRIKTLFVDDLDLGFNLPGAIDVAAALGKVGTVVMLTNTAKAGSDKALVLPPGTALETWGDEKAYLGKHGLGQPGMKPLHDTRSTGDILLAVAKKAGLQSSAASAGTDGETTSSTNIDIVDTDKSLRQAVKDGDVVKTVKKKITGDTIDVNLTTTSTTTAGIAGVAAVAATIDGEAAVANFTAKDFRRYLAGHWNERVFAGGDFKSQWISALMKGGLFKAASQPTLSFSAGAPKPSPGEALAGDLTLLPFLHAHLLDGRHANKAWMQEIPHPVSGYTWSTWVELSEATANRLGVDSSNLVKVKTSAGEIEAQVKVAHGIADTAVALVLGNGHVDGGRYARGFGGNTWKLLGAEKDTLSGAQSLIGQNASISVSASGIVRKDLKGSEDMDNRPVAPNVFVDDVTANKENLHVREGMGIHIVHDPRLEAKGITDMFPEPEHPNHRFGMVIDLDSCNGCGACEAACMAENNVAIAGPAQHERYRFMGWIRLNRFWEGDGEHPDVRYAPAMCQQCAHAPCEGVCPVVATYHNLDGLNAMIYNRCVGTRYCANNCPYSSRRFNWHTYKWPESYELMLNPDVVTREAGVMEKCTFCIQRIRFAKAEAKPDSVNGDEMGRLTACAEVCPTESITFGDVLKGSGSFHKKWSQPRAFELFSELNTKNGIRYLARVSHQKNQVSYYAAHGDGHADASGDHGDGHGEAADGHGANNSHDASGAEKH